MISLGKLAVFAACVAIAQPALPTVDLGYAVHQATINDTGYPYYNFSNIRYGAPPLGNLRFAAPIPPRGVNRTVNDGQQSVMCPQANPAWLLTAVEYLSGVLTATPVNEISTNAGLNLSSIPAPDPNTSEDCLFLDVIVPKSIFDARKKEGDGYESEGDGGESEGGGAPVLVWIYDGGFTAGSKAGNGSPAGLLARARDNNSSGIIYVALNYRLGMFGWLSGPTFQTNGTANAGLYDQRLALNWVKENIYLFGGDPKRVTVMGVSAGGASIMHQITAFGGLNGEVPFQQAISQSPGFQVLPSNAMQENTYQKTLMQLSKMELYYTNYAVVGLSAYTSFSYGPTVDGSFVPKLPGELLLHGQFHKTVKVMVGHNLNEGLFFTPPFIRNETALVSYLISIAPSASQSVIDHITKVLYPPVFNGSYGYQSMVGRVALLLSEASITCNTRYLNRAFQNKAYAYYFTVPPGLHGEDVPYTFFNGDTSTLGDGLPINVTVAKTLQDYITSFAMTGSPNEKGVPFFPLYGANSSTENIGISNLGVQVPDTAANARCDWWQKALYY